MENQLANNAFEVVMIRKVPYLTAGLFHLLMIFTIGLLIVDIYFLPTKHASDEMKFTYFLLATPRLIQNAFLVSLAGFLVILPIYLNLRLHKTAILTFMPDALAIAGSQIHETIPVADISKVYCMDAKSLDGTPSDKLTLHICRKKGKTAAVRLMHYVQAEDFMERLENYGDLRLIAYDFNADPEIDPDNEE